MVAEIIILCAAVAFFVLSTFLLNGKGKWLIAGFNTAPKEEQDKYDVKKLCRASGIVCLVCAVMLCAMAFIGYNVDLGRISENKMLVFGLVFFAVIAISVIIAISYMNTKAKK